jgi:thiamine-phosphate pyrophosphorylase
VQELLPLDRLATARLYLCTDARRERGDLAEFADAALAGGVDIIQLRDKGSAGEQKFGPLEAKQEIEALEVLRDAARKHGALFAVNDRADIARAAVADVLHLGQDDLPLQVARDIVGARPVIGRSCHDATQAHHAATEEVDYFCVGPCWPTPTKPGRSAPGLDLVRAVAALHPEKPWFAIGGIDEQRLPEVLDAGATRVVVVRAITGADDPQAAATRLAAALPAAG